MEEDLNYATVAFTAKNKASTLEKPNGAEIIYDEVKPEVQTAPVIPVVQEKKASSCSCIHLVAAGLGIICVMLVISVIIIKIQFQTAMSEQLRENSNLTALNKQLMSEKEDLQGQTRDLLRQTQELTREKNGLNWTLGVILEFKDFPVNILCPQKVCKPCQDNWVLFQSSCYFFAKHKHSWEWMKWFQSELECHKLYANLVTIESQEEQEFINNQTEQYNDENHGYWIGLTKKDSTEEWRWLDGSNVTVEFWRDQETIKNWYSCALTSPHGSFQAKWLKTSCDMRNRYICETKVLTKQDEEPEAFT